MSDAFWQMIGVAIMALAPVIGMLISQNRRMAAEREKAQRDREELLAKMDQTAVFMNTIAVNSSAFKAAAERKRTSGFGELDP
jgi:uncharacterized membrane protein